LNTATLIDTQCLIRPTSTDIRIKESAILAISESLLKTGFINFSPQCV